MLQGSKKELIIPSYHIEVGGLTIHYKSLGQGQPLIFIHGGANDWHEWRKNIPFFARRFCIYAPDLPGFGLSQKPDEPISPHSMALFIRDFMDALSINRAHIIAHSFGGLVAIATALEYPKRVNKLVIVDSAGIGDLSRKGLFIISFMHAVKKLFGKNNELEFKEGKHHWYFEDRLSRIEQPVLLIWGERDPYLPLSQARTAHHLIPDSKLHIFQNCHHAPQRERTRKFNSLVYSFLVE